MSLLAAAPSGLLHRPRAALRAWAAARTSAADGRSWRGRAAVIVATRNGARTIDATVRSAAGQAHVYVVSDGSTDDTATVARAAGAAVLELAQNVGKPAALHRAIDTFGLTRRYDVIAILDDDTIIAPDFVGKAMRAMKPGVAIVVGKTMTRWHPEKRWNIWLGSRTYAHWRYQASLRRGQSALRAMNCISGSNSIFRSDVLDQVLLERTPYAVDDTWWTLETMRRRLGHIVYAPAARAWLCDPITLRDWYRQNVRWNWGMFQGIWGHRIGRRAGRFDFYYGIVIIDWFLYVAGLPLAFALIAWAVFDPLRFLLAYLLGVLCWVTIAAAATRKWRMIPMTPAFVVIDCIYRATFVHALVKTVRTPRVEACRWESPARY